MYTEHYKPIKVPATSQNPSSSSATLEATKFSRFVTSMVFILLHRDPANQGSSSSSSSSLSTKHGQEFKSSKDFSESQMISSLDVFQVSQDVVRYTPHILQCIHQILKVTARSIPLYAVMLALKYIAKITELKIKIPSFGAEAHLFCICLILAQKNLDDHAFKNRTWAKITRMPVEMVTQMERECLASLAFNIHVGSSEFDRWHRFVQSKALLWNASVESFQAPRPLTPVSDGQLSPPHTIHDKPPSPDPKPSLIGKTTRKTRASSNPSYPIRRSEVSSVPLSPTQGGPYYHSVSASYGGRHPHYHSSFYYCHSSQPTQRQEQIVLQ